MPNYQLTANESGILLDGALIPPDPANRDYQDYLAWVTAGNSPAAAVELPLAASKTAAIQQVSEEADALVRERLPLGTDAYVWPLELAEANAAIASLDPLLNADYPLLAALIDRLGADLDEVAAAVVARQVSIEARIAAVHTKRSQLHTLIEAKTTSAEVRAVVQAIVWPADAGGPDPV